MTGLFIRRVEKGGESFQLRQALGELILVVLGVLIALAADDWNEERVKDDVKEEYINRLLEELRGDSVVLANSLQRLDEKLEYLENIAPYVRGQSSHIPDTLAFLDQVGKAGTYGFGLKGLLKTTTFNDLMHTGNLILIKDPGLRSHLIDYYQEGALYSERLDERRPGYPMYVHRLLPAELREDFNLQAARRFDVGRVLNRLRSEEFEDVMNQEYNFALFARRTIMQYGLENQELIGEVLELEN